MKKLLAGLVCAALLAVAPASAGATEKKGVATGDIAADPDSTNSFTGQSDNAAIVSAFNPWRIFALGDTQYVTGDGADYKCVGAQVEGCGSFDNNEGAGGTSWGPLDDSDTNFVEVVGNHEYYDDSTGLCCDEAIGFRQYFGREATGTHGPNTTDAWDNALYYSVTINTGGADSWNDWTFYVLDSMVCDTNPSECQESGDGDQYDELLADINDDPYRTDPDGAGVQEARDCVGVVMHHSRFSNEDSHDNNTNMNELLDLLDDRAGADLVMSGHSHAYEKYPRQDVDGNTSAQSPRWFVAGLGGTDKRDLLITQNSTATVWDNHTASWTPDLNGGTAASFTGNDAAFDESGGLYGVIKLWFRPGQFDTQFVAQNGTVIDPVNGSGGDGQSGTAWQYACSNDPSV